MGVPRLFRLLVERYPLILRSTEDHPMPEFDNFYLDFNGIVHTCTHGNRADDRVKSQTEMMMDLFSVIEALFDTIRPRKLLYIAIDGVAPRAKMNQQRQRRFKSVRPKTETVSDTEKTLLGAVQSDAQPSDTEHFDSNCITPGTEFMNALDRHLVYFIQRKLDEDADWRGIEVVLSGHQVPGEGEHKIMDFIRSLKSQPGYDPNTRHCLHGLDADLIMLALATHEPHFCILREQVLMRSYRHKKVLNDMDLRQAAFQQTDQLQLIHIGLLREYIEQELVLLKLAPEPGANLTSEQSTSEQATDHSLERLIDDFIFLTFFLGNDFLPHLPTTDLDDDGLDVIFSAYRQARNQVPDGYLVDAETTTVNVEFFVEVVKYFCTEEDAVFAKLTEQNTDYQRALRKAQQASAEPSDDAAAAKPPLTTANPASPSPSKPEPVKASETDQSKPLASPIPQSSAPAPAPQQPASNHLAQLLAKAAAPSSQGSDVASAPKPNPWGKQASKAQPAPKAEPQTVPKVKQAPKAAATQDAGKQETSIGNSASEDGKAADRRKLLAFMHPSEVKSGRRAAAPGRVVKATAAKAPVPDSKQASQQQLSPKQDQNAMMSLLNNAVQQQPQQPQQPSMQQQHVQQLLQGAQPAPTTQEPPAEPEEEVEELVNPEHVGVGKVSDKAGYYHVKFQSVMVDKFEPKDAVVALLEGLRWVLHYYFQQGVASWSWFYPFYAAPLATDVLTHASLINDLKLEQSAPLLPFQQLMAVLPANSSHLLPAPLGALMTTVLADQYPTVYPCIPDHRGREWRDVAIIPFVDVNRLVDAYNDALKATPLSQAEANRNTLFNALMFAYNAGTTVQNESPMLDCFPTRPVRVASKRFQLWDLPNGRFVPQLLPNCMTGQYAPPPSWPTMRFLRFESRLQAAKVQVLHSPSRLPSLILGLESGQLMKVARSQEEQNALDEAQEHPERAEDLSRLIVQAQRAQLARVLLGSVRMVGYPYPGMARVEAAIDVQGTWHMSKRGHVVKSASSQSWGEAVAQVRHDFLTQRGVDVGEVEMILEVAPVVGVTVHKNTVTHHISEQSRRIPAHAIPRHDPRVDARFVEHALPNMDARVQRGDRVVVLSSDYYGRCATVINKRKTNSGELKSLELKVTHPLTARCLSQLARVAVDESVSHVSYLKAWEAAKDLNMNALVLSRLAGSIMVAVDKDSVVCLGLGIKYARKQLCVAGYARQVPDTHRPGNKQWEYSKQAVTLMRALRDLFPDLLEYMEANAKEDTYNVYKLFQSHADPVQRLAECLSWISSQPVAALPLSPVTSTSLSKEAIAKMELRTKQALQYQEETIEIESIEPSAVLPARTIPDKNANSTRLSLGHRVVNVRANGAVPFGLSGTVVSLDGDRAEVLFDEAFLAGSNLAGRASDYRGAAVPIWSLLNLTAQEGIVATNQTNSAKKGKKKKKSKAKPASSNPFEALMM
eukprot:m.118141 g.118141  ORF g.118141 m.118141 type:complete len:1458 (-) comp15562_c0_seq1:189-4562(-)